MDFLTRFNEILEMREMTAYRLSKDTGLSERLVGAWKAGDRKPNMDNLIKLALYFSVSTDYLLGLTDNPTPPQKTAEFENEFLAAHYEGDDPVSPQEQE